MSHTIDIPGKSVVIVDYTSKPDRDFVEACLTRSHLGCEYNRENPCVSDVIDFTEAQKLCLKLNTAYKRLAPNYSPPFAIRAATVSVTV